MLSTTVDLVSHTPDPDYTVARAALLCCSRRVGRSS